MAGPVRTRTSREPAAQARTGRASPRTPVKSGKPVPHPAELQQRLGNRGAMAFGAQSLQAEAATQELPGPSPGQRGPQRGSRGEAEKAPVDKTTEPVEEGAVIEEAAPGGEAEIESPETGAPEQAASAAAGEETPVSTTEPIAATAGTSTGQMPAVEPAEETGAGAGVEISTDSPGGVLKQLVEVRPTASLLAYGKAGEASTGALQKQTEQAQGELPEMPAPTGIPPKSLTAVVEAEIGRGERAPQKMEGEQSGREKPQYPTGVDPGPPAPTPRPTILPGRDESVTEGGDRDMALSAQQALRNIQIFTGEIPGSAGPRPGVDMSGEADPSQLAAYEQSSNQAVGDAKQSAHKETQQDFGEYDIFPPATTEILRSERKLGTRGPTAAEAGDFQVPGDISGALDQSIGSVYRERIGEQHREYLAGEEDYQRDKKGAHGDAQKDIAGLEESTRQEQTSQRDGARLLVVGLREDWQKDIDSIESGYRDKATKAGEKQRAKIEKERIKGEAKAETHLKDAEKKAAQKKRKAEEDVRREKTKKRKKSGGFWGWAKRAASALVDALKKAVNFIYDNLRKAIKGLFELAKKLVLAAIELARKLIVGLIKAFGAILKGFVSIALAAFPETAKRFNAKIDAAVDTAVAGVNKAAEMLKKGVAAIIDFLASTIDSLLGLIQSIYNGIFTVIGMIIRGEFGELMKRIRYLVTAARMAPSRFETAAYEELLGGNLDEPLSPMELAQAGVVPKTAEGGGAAPGPEPAPPWTSENIGVDAVDNNMELSPELSAALINGGSAEGVYEFGESRDPQRTMNSLMEEVRGEQRGPSDKGPKYPPDGLTPTERAKIKWKNMKTGLAKWWQDNKVAIIAGTVAAIVGLIAAIIISGGSILAAIPPIMSVLGPIFVGVTIAAIGTRVRDYVSQSWEGNVREGSKSLAKALAAGAIELISYLTFKVGGAALKAGKAAVKTGAKAVRGTLGAARRAAAAGAKYVISKGKVIFKGIAGSGIGKRAKSLRELGERFLSRMRFRKFRVRVTGYRFKLEGYINPWILLASGKLEKIDQSKLKNLDRPGETARVGDTVKIGRKKGIVVGSHAKGDEALSAFVKNLDEIKKSPTKLKKEYKRLRDLEVDARKRAVTGGKSFDFDEARKLYGEASAKAIRDRGNLRKALKMGDDAGEAHHVLPVEALESSPALQKAVEGGFKFNGKINGRPLSKYSSKSAKTASGRHASHPNYTQRVLNRLSELDELAENGLLTKAAAKKAAEDLAAEIGGLIDNSTGKIDDLMF